MFSTTQFVETQKILVFTRLLGQIKRSFLGKLKMELIVGLMKIDIVSESLTNGDSFSEEGGKSWLF